MRSGFDIMRTTVHALLLRELKTRFGKYRLGYLWALLEPVAHMAILLLVLGFIMRRAMPGVSFPVFLLSGIVPYMLFSNISLRSLNAIEANRGLFSYRPVHPLDAVLARALLESLIYVLVYLMLMSGLWLAGETIQLSQLPLLATAWLLLSLLALGCGLVFMVLGHAFKTAEKLLPILMKPLYFLSGIMFPPSLIPGDYRWLVDWNPLLHAFELMRHAILPGYPLNDDSLSYLFAWTLVLLFAGLSLYKGREPAMLRS
ncbi:ABC transporter permease [Chromobacterium rhizoryzae]|uniref:ABC transporter permease n=1 Tax=Chromobacterium rhizoryzae TaxID=1778675 RepID=UPI001D067DC4|nr:ABC transporter permease [Chromobacterium rhizoryzae]